MMKAVKFIALSRALKYAIFNENSFETLENCKQVYDEIA